MSRRSTSRTLSVGPLIAVLMGAVVAPAILSVAVGVVALTLSQQAVDIVVGVLVLCFAVSAISGGFVTFGLLHRVGRLSRLQDDFVANVSHELRTPVAGIRILAESIKMGRSGDADRTREVGELILRRTEHLQELVERILRWRVVAGAQNELDVRPHVLAEIVSQAIESLESCVAESAPNLRVDVDPRLPRVLVDRSALLDVVRNLIHNAIKFGGADGPIEISARRADREVILEVRDQGPGIPKSDQKRVFEQFYRVPVHLRAKQGAGLGLSIVHGTLRQLGGRIAVQSEPGIGTVFCAHLPSQELSTTPEARPTPDASRATEDHGGSNP